MLIICFNVIYEYTSLFIRNQASSLEAAYMRGVLASNRFKISIHLSFQPCPWSFSSCCLYAWFSCIEIPDRIEFQTYLQHQFEILPRNEIVVRVCAFLGSLFSMCRNISVFELTHFQPMFQLWKIQVVGFY